MADGKIGWIKTGIEYIRENELYSQASEGITARDIDRNLEAVKTAIIDEFSSWTGKGKVKVLWVQTGPYREDQIPGLKSLWGLEIEFNN